MSLAPARPREPAPAALDAAGARVILGAVPAPPGAAAAPIAPERNTLFGPRGLAVAADGSLWVADTGHHRLLGWARLPSADGTPADWLVGHADFRREGRNSRGAVSGASLNVPTGVCACGTGIAVADAWNHRVLLWHHTPRGGEPADAVLGQADFASGDINRGRASASPDSLYWPYGVYWDGEQLWVADTGNRRVLFWRGLPSGCGQSADGVLGQPDFTHRDENAGDTGWGSLRWPHALSHWQGKLCVADAGNNRVLLWPPGADCAQRLIGQADEQHVDHNRGEYWPSASSFNMPYGLAVHESTLLVADTANSRILRFAPEEESANALAGQESFNDKGDNRWRAATRHSLCWPYALAVHGGTCLIADSGNSRVLLWELAP